MLTSWFSQRASAPARTFLTGSDALCAKPGRPECCFRMSRLSAPCRGYRRDRAKIASGGHLGPGRTG